VARTHGVLLCRPFWMWGAEMGTNEHGVAIGNEGLVAKSASPEANALTGMDLVRLGLERATTAAEAVEVITSLLERHGQGGNGGHLAPAYYNNGFMIADRAEAFVLETLEREWLLERVDGTRAMSNVYTIGCDVARISSGLHRYVLEAGWTQETHPNYAAAIGYPNREHIGQARARCSRSTSLLRAREGNLTTRDLFEILRDHGPADPQHVWNPRDSLTATLCMHAGMRADGQERQGQTVGSLVSELRPNDSVHWVTATAAPCISIFKPLMMDVPLPSHGGELSDRFDPGTLWWLHEQLHRAALGGDFPACLRSVIQERDLIEARSQIAVHAALEGGSLADRMIVVNDCWREALEAERRWREALPATILSVETLYDSGWREMSRRAGLP
jgi:dipeptidase